jgi:hypothetical protein
LNTEGGIEAARHCNGRNPVYPFPP